jgi:hypothetical protein
VSVEVVFWTVVLVRFFLPLLIFRYPLPAIIACLIVDGIDQSIFQSFGFDPPFYQGYDKAMDVFYLGMAYISTLRNWVNLSAFNVSRFLFFYRQIGVVAFELTQVRALLLIFPNTFEYFFIAYEGIRSRWNTVRFQLKFWVLLAAGIWIFIKLPQEYWIHVAQLDFTDTVKEVSWFLPAIVVGVLVLLGVFWFVVRPRLDPADHRWQLVAAPLPAEMDEGRERWAFYAEHGKVWSVATVEKVLLIGLLGVIFANVLPGVELPFWRLFLWTAYFVLINAAITLWLARRQRSVESVVASFFVRVVVNLGILIVVDAIWSGTIQIGDALFFLFLFSVLITLYDRYRPVYEFRLHTQQTEEQDRTASPS